MKNKLFNGCLNVESTISSLKRGEEELCAQHNHRTSVWVEIQTACKVNSIVGDLQSSNDVENLCPGSFNQLAVNYRMEKTRVNRWTENGLR